MKRGRPAKDQLTGGSGDVNPQTITFTATQSGNDANTVQHLQLPIPRLPTAVGRNLVIELLSVDAFHGNPQVPGPGTTSSFLATITTAPGVFATPIAAVIDPRCIEFWAKAVQNVTSIGLYKHDTDYTADLTDQAGHGILIASDTLYFGLYSNLTAVPNQVVWKLNYRWKDVSLTEYIGIVQSQQ